MLLLRKKKRCELSTVKMGAQGLSCTQPTANRCLNCQLLGRCLNANKHYVDKAKCSRQTASKYCAHIAFSQLIPKTLCSDVITVESSVAGLTAVSRTHELQIMFICCKRTNQD